MAKIVSFMTEKEGSGKTTLCAITAVAVHNWTKKKVLVIDGDKGGLKDLREMKLQKGLSGTSVVIPAASRATLFLQGQKIYCFL